MNHPYWRFAGVMITDSLHNGENILDDFTSELVIGDWFEITEKDNRKYLSIRVNENKEKQRSIRIGLDSGGTGSNFLLIQKGGK
ncbi:MAG: hypothetical protein LIP05_08290 [Tannerellaceae bacterium]|nr:hypothetical protein [Tannerellaceae bacterium]MCC8133063.1 hypothetical protein [Tannerellaceae bacterium]